MWERHIVYIEKSLRTLRGTGFLSFLLQYNKCSRHVRNLRHSERSIIPLRCKATCVLSTLQRRGPSCPLLREYGVVRG